MHFIIKSTLCPMGCGYCQNGSASHELVECQCNATECAVRQGIHCIKNIP